MFHRPWVSGDDAWSRHRVSIYDARAGGPAQRVGFGPCGKLTPTISTGNTVKNKLLGMLNRLRPAA
jgi:hypothetical protein